MVYFGHLSSVPHHVLLWQYFFMEVELKSRRWVKVWHEILSDSQFQELSLAQQARYYTLLVYCSAHGESGTLIITAPARMLSHLLQCDNYENIVSCIRCLPNINIVENSNANISVTFLNWHKYQVDSTVAERQKRFRNKNVTPKEKEKDKEKEKKKILSSRTPISDSDFISKLKENPAYKGINIDNELHKMDAWLMTPKGRGRSKTHKFILNWINKAERIVIETEDERYNRLMGRV